MSSEPKSCPHCGQSAPILNRGVLSYCTACGQPRVPFSATSVTLAGQPSKFGGTLAAVVGWIVMGVGAMIALTIGLILQLIFPGALAAWGLAGMIAVVSIGLGLALLLSGRSLRRMGTRTAQQVHDQAVFALAAHKGGIVTAKDLSLAIGGTVEASDAMLTDMTKRSDLIVLEVDNEGHLFYRFPQIIPEKRRWLDPDRPRVAAPDAPQQRVAPEAVPDDAPLEDEAVPERRQTKAR